MAVVTGIVASPRREGRFDLLVEGKDRGVVSLPMIEQLGLRIGLDLPEARLAEVDEAIATLATYDRALNILAANPRSRRDLRRRLLQKGEPEARVDAALARLADAGLVNDDAFARQFTRSRVLGRGASKRRVRDELFKRGVTGETASEAIAEVFEDEQVDESALVETAARKKLRTLSKLDAPTQRRRLYAFLARRGYDGADIRTAMGRVLGAAGAEDALDEIPGED
jgi:regulatory protein